MLYSAEFVEHTKPCWHASAAKKLLPEEADWLAPLSDDGMYDRISEVVLEEPALNIIHADGSSPASLALSVCLTDTGYPRCIVGAGPDGSLCCQNGQCCSKKRQYSCAHCKHVVNQLAHIESEIDGEDVATATVENNTAVLAELQGLQLHLRGKISNTSLSAAAAAAAMISSSSLPVSFHYLVPHLGRNLCLVYTERKEWCVRDRNVHLACFL